MSIPMWKKLDQVESPPARLEASDMCFYARDYASGKDFNYSEANSLIKNFKKPVSTRGTGQWYYKERAISQFATELAGWLSQVDADYFIAAIPPSRRRDDPEYDPRLDMVLQQLAPRCPRARLIQPIDRAVSRTPAHLSGSSRPSVQDVYDSLSWNGTLTPPPDTLVLIDDVITAGTSFKACQRLVAENAPGVTVVGVFWARTVWPDDPLAGVDLSGLL